MSVVQTQWAPIADDAVHSSAAVVNNTTPPLTSDTLTTCQSVAASDATPQCALTPVKQRSNPLPVFEWADSRQMWETMMSKEELPGYQRDSSWFVRHALLQPRMRTVLLDWLMEVIFLIVVSPCTVELSADTCI